jgi:hypothetical protein
MLRDWIAVLLDVAPRLTDVHLVFNNCHRAQGINNARRMAELIRADAPAFCVVEPPAVPSQLQTTLFED